MKISKAIIKDNKQDSKIMQSSKKSAKLHSGQILGESIELYLEPLLLAPGPLNTIPSEPQQGESLDMTGDPQGHNKLQQNVKIHIT